MPQDHDLKTDLEPVRTLTTASLGKCSYFLLVNYNKTGAGGAQLFRRHSLKFLVDKHIQCALATVRARQFPEVRSRYLALKKRRGHRKEIIAIDRMLLTAICNMLKKNEAYNPKLYRKGDRPPANREVSVDEAIYILQRQGYLATAPSSP